MIEALVSSLQDQGYLVDVLPGILIIRKYVQGQLLSLSWMIAQADVKNFPKEALFDMADRKLAELRRAEQAGPPKEHTTPTPPKH